MFGLAVILALGLVLLWAGAVVATAWMLTHPPRRTYAWAVARNKPGDPSELDRPRKFESWSFKSRGLELPVWEVVGDDPAGPTVVLTHGWADSRIGGLARIEAIAPVASRIISWDLPGLGASPGLCALGMIEAFDLVELLQFRRLAGQVVLYGWSLGAGVSIVAARRETVAAVIAESPYRLALTPARGVLRARSLPHRTTLGPALALVRFMFRRTPPALGGGSAGTAPFDRAELVAHLHCPVLVLHGVEDEVCPVDDGRHIAAAAPYGTLVEVPGAHHNDLWTDPALAARCAEAIRAFLRGLPHSDAP